MQIAITTKVTWFLWIKHLTLAGYQCMLIPLGQKVLLILTLKEV